ncbi:MAG: hypothetical protein PHP82_03955 [Candidatus ainarchaeum sp.]|nr:hypothetical protein [Candidatus ainarchaeum sp.]
MNKKLVRPFLKKNRKTFRSTSGDVVVKGRKKIVKFFVDGNEARPFSYGRTRTIPITNHSAIKYYSELMQQKPARNRNERIYGAPPPKTFIVRPVKLIKQTKRYHVVENVNGPNLLDFVSFVETRKGPRIIKSDKPNSETKSDIIMRRKILAKFAFKHRAEIRKWSKNNLDFMRELFEQMNWIKEAGDGRVDIYKHELKETDFIVEGFSKEKDGSTKIKLVMVDFR